MRETTAAFTPMTREKLAQRREWTSGAAQAPRADVPFEEHMVPRVGCPADPGDVRVYAVNARPGENRPAILHIHGGGFTASSAANSLPMMQDLACELDVPVVTVDYRLAPETIWSGSLEDNYSALLWTVENAGRLGIDPSRIAVMGESAGGGHAALLTLAARDRGEVSLASQVLVYPMLDDRAGTSRPAPEHIGYFGWNPEANRFGWESFLGMAPGGQDVPAAAVPARVEDLAGLPPAFICCGALDLFVEEDIAYASRLLASGVPTELLIVPGAFHGFDMFVPDAAISRRFTAAKVDALRRGLGLDG
ncbi:MAG: alpha/beta hydrolase [Novosphingobium sp.]|nr:alpha/beta hydrolase [Novosphingobium sp.]MCP5402797.1 alpha/beta hydrolase [Novosphingobium sp.]